MYQRATREYAAQSPTRQAPQPDRHAAIAVGKTTLLPQVAPHFGPADARAIAIEGAQREVRAIRVVLFPALVKALRSKAPAFEKQREVAQAAMQLRYMLTTVNTRVFALEKTAIHPDPMLQFLRKEITALAGHAKRLGVYQGRDHLIPQGYEEPIKHSNPAVQRTPRPTEHEHVPAKNPVAAQQIAQLRRRRPVRATSSPRIRLRAPNQGKAA